MKSTFAGEIQLNFSSLVVDEISLIGSRCGPFEPALQLLASGEVDPNPMIEAVYSIEQGKVAIDHASKPGH